MIVVVFAFLPQGYDFLYCFMSFGLGFGCGIITAICMLARSVDRHRSIYLLCPSFQERKHVIERSHCRLAIAFLTLCYLVFGSRGKIAAGSHIDTRAIDRENLFFYILCHCVIRNHALCIKQKFAPGIISIVAIDHRIAEVIRLNACIILAKSVIERSS